MYINQMTSAEDIPETRTWFTVEHLRTIGIQFASRKPTINNRCQMPLEIGQLIDEMGRIIPGCYQTRPIKYDDYAGVMDQ